jgi:hypothetical protein
MAKLMTGGVEAHNVGWFCISGAILAGALPVLSALWPRSTEYLPSGIGFAVGLYVPPNWTIPAGRRKSDLFHLVETKTRIVRAVHGHRCVGVRAGRGSVLGGDGPDEDRWNEFLELRWVHRWHVQRVLKHDATLLGRASTWPSVHEQRALWTFLFATVAHGVIKFFTESKRKKQGRITNI